MAKDKNWQTKIVCWLYSIDLVSGNTSYLRGFKEYPHTLNPDAVVRAM